MNYYDDAFIDEILTAIETEYGEQVERIAKVKEINGVFHMTIIFVDYCILEAKIQTCEFCDMPSIRIQGKYY